MRGAGGHESRCPPGRPMNIGIVPRQAASPSSQYSLNQKPMMSRSFRRFVHTAFIGLSVITLALTASADAPTSEAQTFIEKEHGHIKQLVDSNAPQAQVNQAIDGMVDFQEIAQRAFGKPCPATIPNCADHWDDEKLMTPARKKEVTE